MRRATCSLQIQPSLPASSKSEETGDGFICKPKRSVIELGSNAGSKVDAYLKLSVGLSSKGKIWRGTIYNRPFPSSPGPLFQNEGRCSAFDMDITFHSHANKTHFHKKGCAPSLILKVRVLESEVPYCSVEHHFTKTRLKRQFL